MIPRLESASSGWLEDGLARVRELLGRGDVQAAMDESLMLLGEAPDHAQVLLRVCFLLTEAGAHHEALKFSDRMVRLAPDTPETRSCKACCLFNVGRVAEAHAEALIALDLDPENLDALRIALRSSLQGVNDVGLEGHSATLLCEGDQQHDVALVLAYLASISRGEPFGMVFACGGTLTGVALCLARPGDVIELEMSLGRVSLARLAANQHHPALRLAGLPEGHAFVYAIPQELMGVELSARLPSGKPCVGSPLRPADSMAQVEGQVRVEGRGMIVGHAWMRPAPGKRLVLEFEGEHGRRLRLTANSFREELVAAGVHDGAHGFSLEWPMAEGVACEIVHVREVRSGQGIPGGPVTVFSPRLLAAALTDMNRWLRQAAERPDTPPSLPESCRGPVLRLFRERQAQWIRELNACVARRDNE